MMLRDSEKRMLAAAQNQRSYDNGEDMDDTYFTYRPLSNLPTPPPSSRDSSAAQSPKPSVDDEDILDPKFRGPAIHLVNLIPSAASLATASVPLVQGMLGRANLPIETVALAVCILDSLDKKFARMWRLSCPLSNTSEPLSPATTASINKRHTLPPTPLADDMLQPRHLHIDSVRPELMILSALVIAAKFTEDPQEPAAYYTRCWGKALWSSAQLNVTERLVMESLGYRIMPLTDEAYLADAMVDMQLAARQVDWCTARREPSPPEGDSSFVPSHARSKTMMPIGLGLALENTSRVPTPRP